MVKKKNKQTASQFPKIYRFITENKLVSGIHKSSIRLLNQPKAHKLITIVSTILVTLFIIILTFAIVFFAINLYKNVNNFKQINSERQKLQSQINFWESIASKYDGYKDAYFRIALLEYRLNNLQKAEENNKKALLLDPNFDDAKKLESLLNKK